MPNDFHQTVNLREKMEKERAARLAPVTRAQKAPEKEAPSPSKPINPPAALARNPRLAESRRAENIDQVYRSDEDGTARYDPRQISRPAERKINEKYVRWAVLGAAILLIAFGAWWWFGRGGDETADGKVASTPKWCVIELINGEIYYGQVSDFGANPVVVGTVYYNYDQINPDASKQNGSDSLKLVKRGKETAGPSGTMYIYQAQIGKIDELKEDSKVLKAILDYEQ